LFDLSYPVFMEASDHGLMAMGRSHPWLHRQTDRPSVDPDLFVLRMTFGRWAAVKVRLGEALLALSSIAALTVLAVVAILHHVDRAIPVLGGLAGGYLALVGIALLVSLASRDHHRRAYAYAALQLLLHRQLRQGSAEHEGQRQGSAPGEGQDNWRSPGAIPVQCRRIARGQLVIP
jgi:hypothetical protein